MRAIQAAFRCHIRQRIHIRQVCAIDEIRLEQDFRHCVLLALLLGVMQQPVRVHRVGLHFDLVERKRNADGLAHFADTIVIALAARAEFSRNVIHARNAFGRQIGI